MKRTDTNVPPPDPHLKDGVKHARVEPEWNGYDGNDRSTSERRIKFTPFANIKLSTSPRYVVKGILPRVGLALVWGPQKCGKSFWTFDLVAHAAAGWTYRGRRVKQCPVIYFALEGQLGFEARVAAFRKAHSVDNLSFYLSTDRIVLPHDGRAIVAAITKQFSKVKPGIVVLDTLNRSIAGNENDSGDMGAYIKAADFIRETFDCLVIIIHHCGVDQKRPRGHTSLPAALDAQIAVHRDGNGNVVAMVENVKDGPKGDAIVSLLEQVSVGTDDDGEDITSCVITPSDMKAKTGLKGQAKRAFEILCDTISESPDEQPPATVTARTKARTCLESAWRENCYAGMTSGSLTRTSQQKAFVRAMDTLLAAKVIGKWGDYVWLV